MSFRFGSLGCFSLLAFLSSQAARATSDDVVSSTQLAGVTESMSARDFSGALHQSETLLAAAPKDVTLLRLQAVCLLEKNRTGEAILLLRRALALDEHSASCRYYLAQALAYEGSTTGAVRLLEQIEAEAPGSDYARQAAGVLPRLRLVAQTVPDSTAASAPERRFRVHLRTAGEYDDNVPLRAKADPVSAPNNSFRLVLSEYAEYRPVDQKLDGAPVTLGVSYGGYQSLHERSALTRYDLSQTNLSAWVERAGAVAGIPYRLQVSGRFEYTELGYHRYDRAAHLENTLTLQHFDWLTTALHYNVGWRDFSGDTALRNVFARDGCEQSVGLFEYVRFWQDRMVLGLGYSYLHDDPEGSQFVLDSHQVALSLQASLPWQLTLGALAEFRNEDYPNFQSQPRRKDDVFTGSVTLSRPLVPHLSAEVGYAFSESSSSRAFAAYRRNVISLALDYEF